MQEAIEKLKLVPLSFQIHWNFLAHRVTVRPDSEVGEKGAPAAGADLGRGPAPQPRGKPDLRAARVEPGKDEAERVSLVSIPRRTPTFLALVAGYQGNYRSELHGFLRTKVYRALPFPNPHLPT